MGTRVPSDIKQAAYHETRRASNYSSQMYSLLLPALAGLSGLLVVYAAHRYLTRISISKVPGPPSKSWLLGTVPDLYRSLVGKIHFEWLEKYGDVVRVPGPLGEQYLLISDPKALQYIHHTSGYRFSRNWPERRIIQEVMLGRGLLLAESDMHKRQRKIMLPGFGAAETRALLPIFQSCATSMVDKWEDLVATSTSQSTVIDLPSWLSRATLDAIGQAAFDYNFDSLGNENNEVAKLYQNLFLDAVSQPSNTNLMVLYSLKFMPEKWAKKLILSSKSHRINRLVGLESVVQRLSEQLVKQKYQAALDGKGSRDVMSLMVNANASENPAMRMTDSEMYSVMHTLVLAGHETTANSLSWTLLELTRQPKYQDQLRAEIRRKIQEKGDRIFTEHDFETMPFLTAVLKESLRIHPVAFMLFRLATQDEVIPLSKPVTLTDGTMITELPIPKGQGLFINVCGYQRKSEIFGEDPHTFKPERWLEGGKKGVNVGVYSNMLSFGGGLRGCIGWRFALLEMQAMLVEMIERFEFTLAVDHNRVRRESSGVMAPTIEGMPEKGVHLPYIIKPAPQDAE